MTRPATSLAARIDVPEAARSGEDGAVNDAADGRGAPRKSVGAFRTIKEAADELDVPQHVLRFWETRFSQIRPVKRAGGRRYYRPEDVDLLRGIRRLLHGQGYTIRGAQRILRERGLRFVQSVGRGEAVAAAPSLQDADDGEAGRDPSTVDRPTANPLGPDRTAGDGPTVVQRAALERALDDLEACRSAIARLRVPPEPDDGA